MIARRAQGIEPFHVMDILRQARGLEARGADVIHMEVGEPDFPTPQPIVAAGHQALRDGYTHYTPASGLPRLRQAISDYYQSRFGVAVAPERILITPGASGALQLALAALLDPDHKVLMADPGYPCNRHMVRLLGGIDRGLGVKASQRFALAPDQVLRHWDQNTRVLMLATPANPTGQILSLEQMAALYEVVRAPGGALVVDEIYQGLVYGQPSVTALALGEDELFVVNSFSKFFGMTGWRLGWLVAPTAYVEVLERLAQNLFLAAPTPAQHAALAAFQPETLDILEQRRRLFQQRRDYLHAALIELGFRIPYKPAGAFYLYADISAFSEDSFDWCRKLLEEQAVAVTPGKDFGHYRAQRFVRFAYTTNMQRLQQSVQRIAEFVQNPSG